MVWRGTLHTAQLTPPPPCVQAFFTASCDVGATSVKGTRAYYLYTDLTVHQVPIPNIKEHQVAANADMAASGYLGRDGVVYFTAGITCSDLCVDHVCLCPVVARTLIASVPLVVCAGTCGTPR